MSESARAAKVAQPLQRSCVCGGRCDKCAEKKRFHVLREEGLPLDRETRGEMEARFGHDFGRVRIHAGAQAAESAQSIGASAYTIGRHIVFSSNDFMPRSRAGRGLLAHELTHVVQQSALPVDEMAPVEISDPHSAHEVEADARSRSAGSITPLTRPLVQRQPPPQSGPTTAPADPDTVCFTGGAAPDLPGDCAAMHPENCVTYEQWLMSFRGMSQIPGASGVLGGRRADETTGATPQTQPVPPRRPRITDHFIDHPTQRWVNNCLPPNLRDTAYVLPSDCADIALILRHVWLSAHHRTEQHGRFTLGDTSGGAAQERARQTIAFVGASNLPSFITPYADTRGRPIRSFAQLAPILHPGDVLVWAHDERGIFHSNTISEITRDASGTITSITFLEGDQPLGAEDTPRVQAATPRGQTPPSVTDVRQAPARRIQADVISGPSDDSTGVWRWEDKTLLAAGPMLSVARPARRGRERSMSDWNRTFASATLDRLPIVFEAALVEIRSLIERGTAGVESQIDTLAHAAGERLWRVARTAAQAARPGLGALGEASHFRPLQTMEALIGAFASPTGGTVPANSVLWNRLLNEFRLAARGGTSISFARSVPRGTRIIRILVTGFDPFGATVGSPVPAGSTNPSEALALALDGRQFSVRSGVVAAVESVVLPVDWDQFTGSPTNPGIVQRIIQPLITSSGVDAVLTTSLDESIGVGGAPRLERFVVGVHAQGGLTRTPPEQGSGSPAGNIISEAVDVGDIATRTNTRAGAGTVTVGNALHLRIPDAQVAQFQSDAPTAGCEDAAACATPAPGANVCVCDPVRIREIMGANPSVPAGSTSMTFTMSQHRYTGTVVEGPGGNFLSNEVSYRTLRMLGAASRSDITSFHTHLPPLATDNSVPAGDAPALRGALGQRTRLLTAMTAIIRTVAARIADRPQAPH